MKKEECGHVLKMLRRKENLTQRYVAEKMGRTPQTITQWESGASQPDMGNFLKLCEMYGVRTLDAFMDDSDVPDPAGAVLKKYNMLDLHGRMVVELLLDAEYQRCVEMLKN